MEDLWECPRNDIPSFARGLSILLVDHDTTSLLSLAIMLEQFSFKVATTELECVALNLIQEQKGRFKLVIYNVITLSMEAFSFLRLLVQNDMPVILISSFKTLEEIQTVLAEGATMCLNNPVSPNELKSLWQQVYRKRKPQGEYDDEDKNALILVQANPNKEENNELDPQALGIDIEEPPTKNLLHGTNATDYAYKGNGKKVEGCHDDISRELSSIDELRDACVNKNQDQNKNETENPNEENNNEGDNTNQNPNEENKEGDDGSENNENENDEDEQENEKDDNNTNRKKKRIVWTPKLHRKFTAAISVLGENSRPKAILEMMKEPSLTQRQIASHLQKYKAQVRKLNEEMANRDSPSDKSNPPFNIADYIWSTGSIVTRLQNRYSQRGLYGGSANPYSSKALHYSTMGPAPVSKNKKRKERSKVPTTWTKSSKRQLNPQQNPVATSNHGSMNYIPTSNTIATKPDNYNQQLPTPNVSNAFMFPTSDSFGTAAFNLTPDTLRVSGVPVSSQGTTSQPTRTNSNTSTLPSPENLIASSNLTSANYPPEVNNVPTKSDNFTRQLLTPDGPNSVRFPTNGSFGTAASSVEPPVACPLSEIFVTPPGTVTNPPTCTNSNKRALSSPQNPVEPSNITSMKYLPAVNNIPTKPDNNTNHLSTLDVPNSFKFPTSGSSSNVVSTVTPEVTCPLSEIFITPPGAVTNPPTRTSSRKRALSSPEYPVEASNLISMNYPPAVNNIPTKPDNNTSHLSMLDVPNSFKFPTSGSSGNVASTVTPEVTCPLSEIFITSTGTITTPPTWTNSYNGDLNSPQNPVEASSLAPMNFPLAVNSISPQPTTYYDDHQLPIPDISDAFGFSTNESSGIVASNVDTAAFCPGSSPETTPILPTWTNSFQSPLTSPQNLVETSNLTSMNYPPKRAENYNPQFLTPNVPDAFMFPTSNSCGTAGSNDTPAIPHPDSYNPDSGDYFNTSDYWSSMNEKMMPDSDNFVSNMTEGTGNMDSSTFSVNNLQNFADSDKFFMELSPLTERFVGIDNFPVEPSHNSVIANASQEDMVSGNLQNQNGSLESNYNDLLQFLEYDTFFDISAGEPNPDDLNRSREWLLNILNGTD